MIYNILKLTKMTPNIKNASKLILFDVFEA